MHYAPVPRPGPGHGAQKCAEHRRDLKLLHHLRLIATQEWLPDLNAHVEAQFDTLNKKKDWYEGVVTQVNGDDTMTVLFKTNVSEQNLHPDRVRMLGGKPPKVRSLVSQFLAAHHRRSHLSGTTHRFPSATAVYRRLQ